MTLVGVKFKMLLINTYMCNVNELDQLEAGPTHEKSCIGCCWYGTYGSA